MGKLWLVIKREYRTRVLTKGFVLSTVFIPALIVGMIVFQTIVERKQPDRPLRIAILDEAGSLAPSIAARLAAKEPQGGRPAFQVEEALDKPPFPAAARARLESSLRQKQLDGVLLIPSGALGKDDPEFLVNNPGFLTVLDSLDQAVSDAVVVQRLRKQGLDAQDLTRLVKGVDVKLITVTGQGETEEKGQTFGVAIAVAIILYGSLLMYGITTMRSIIEEKSTRMMEILASSVDPFQLMAGKILGVAAVGLTQFLIWTVSGSLLAAYGISMARAFSPSASGLSIHVAPALVAYAVVFFLGGYFLFASIYAAVGAIVSNEQDAQQVQMPVTLVIVASFLLFGIIMRSPSSRLSVALSLVPFFSPILMTMRISLQPPPFWQIGLAIVLLLGTAVLMVYVSAKIYRVGILMYGKRPSLVEVFRWLRYS